MFLRRLVLGTSLVALSTGIAAAQTTTNGSNASTVENNGTNNEAVVSNGAQGNDNNSSTVVFEGQGHRATVTQVGDNNSSAARLVGGNNNTRVNQNGDQHKSIVRQVGNSNVVAVNQADGNRNSSDIDQFIDPGIGSYANRQASVEQHGSDNSSTVRQVHWDNSATVVQGIAQPGRQLLSQGNSSQIIQFSAENIARVFMFEGSVQAPNRSFIEQTRIDPVVTRNLADVSIRGFGNHSQVTQIGGLHVAMVSILGGGVGVNRSLGRENGNFSFIRQYGDLGHVARVSVGGLVSTPALANEVFIDQDGSHPSIQASAQVWQQGQGDRLNIRQILLGGEEGGGWADTSQRGSSNQINLAQFGRQFATLTQGLGGLSSLNLAQLDSSGGVTRDTRVTEPPYRGNNSFVAAQYGSRNEVEAWQQGSDNRATVWQKVGTNLNRIDLNQGRPSTSVEGATHCQAVCRFVSGASAIITQGGGFNSAKVNQYGSQHVATVEQFGTGDSGFSRGLVIVTQTGTIGNRARVLQTATAGSSAFGDPASGNSATQNQQATGDPNATADAFYFAGGRRDAEARIYQTGGNSTATIEQRGRGQFALIDQSGSNNEAAILQDVGATNATAVIQQSGNGNSYSVTQNEAGQYIHVRQSGTNNSVTDVIRRGPGS